MKTLIAAVAVATVVASPVLAQSYDPSVGSGNLNSAPYRTNQTAQGSTPYDARAQTRVLARRHYRANAQHYAR